MGQKRRKAYDPFTRLKVFEKLTSLKGLHPGLSWERIAGEISDAGVEFDRKYFQRLVPGPIPDSRVKAIIDWICGTYDPEFIKALESDSRLFADPNATRYVVSSSRTWRPVPYPEIRSRLEKTCLTGLPSGYLARFSAEYYIPNFLPAARILRITPFRHHSLKLNPIYLIDTPRKMIHLEGRRSELFSCLMDIGASINHHNAIDYISFFIESIDNREEFHFVTSNSDLMHYFLRDGGRSFESACKSVASMRGAVEPPVIEIGDGVHRVRIDAISFRGYIRLFFEIKSDLSVVILNKTRVSKLKFFNEDDHGEYNVIDFTERTDLTNILSILSESKSGNLLLTAASKGNLKYSIMRSSSLSYDYDAESNSIIVSINPLLIRKPGYEIAALAYALRLADQHYLGLFADFEGNAMQFATSMHTKNLDAIVWTCRVVSEYQESEHAYDAMSFIIRKEWSDIYDGVVNNKSPEELFDLYRKY